MDEEEAPVRQSRIAKTARFFNQADHYKKLLFRYWWIPLLAIGLSEWIQLNLLKHTPSTFVSTGSMILNVKLSIPDANVYSEDVDNFFGTQVALMQSDSVINRVKLKLQSANPELRPIPVKVNVSVVPKTSIFSLRAVGEDANYTQLYLQAIMDEYINLKKDLLTKVSDATQSSMQDEVGQMAMELQKSKKALLDYEQSNNVVYLQPDGGNDPADYLSSLVRQLDERKSELLLLESLTLDQNVERQQGASAQRGSMTQMSGPDTTQDQWKLGSPHSDAQQNPVLGTQSNPAANATNDEFSLNNMPSTLSEFEGSYLEAKQQIVLLKAERDELGKYGMATNAPEMISVNKEIIHEEELLQIFKEQSEEQLKNRQHTLEVQIEVLEDQVKEWELKTLDASKKLAAFGLLKEDQSRLQTIYDQMQANLQTLNANKEIGQESVTVLEPATPALPVPLEAQKHLIMAGLIGLVLGVCIIMLMGFLDDRPSSFIELEELFDMPVLGQFPLVKAKNKIAGVPVLQLHDDRYPLIEAYRSLRSALLFKDSLNGQSKGQPKRIVISSAIPNDGKSMVSSNLAITLAQAGARVLLIDADLRRGVLHKHFSVAASPGLAEVLTGRCAWITAVVQTPIPNLDLMPCGTSSGYSDYMFATAGKFLEEITGHYDYYLFDTSPVMVGDDVLSLAPLVDGLIMVIRSEFTSGRIAQAALDLLHQRQVNVIGLVFNAVDPKSGDYYYYRSKEYYPQRQTT